MKWSSGYTLSNGYLGIGKCRLGADLMNVTAIWADIMAVRERSNEYYGQI